MKLDSSKLLAKITPLILVLKRYQVFLFILLFLGIYTFLVLYVSNLVQQEPPASVSSTEAETIKRLKIDQQSIDKIQELEEQNIEVRALFEEARNNPFTE